MELLNENGLIRSDGKGFSLNTLQTKLSLVNSTFASIISGHSCFNIFNNMPSKFKNVNTHLIKQNFWIMDSRANDHILYTLDNFVLA